jgi:hypothetical protein
LSQMPVRTVNYLAGCPLEVGSIQQSKDTILKGIFACLSALAFGCCVVALTMPALAQAKEAGCADMEDIDPDNHGTIDLTAAKKAGTELIHENNPEFLKVVEERFKAADADNDGTVDCNELHTPEGHLLLRVTSRGGTVRSHARQPKMPLSK